MPVLNIEVGEDGKIAGDLPDPLKAHLQSQIDAEASKRAKEASDKAFNEGFAKGNAKKAEELRPYIVDPAEKERAKSLEQELEKLKIADLERDKKYEEANKIREERHAKDLSEAADRVKTRDGKLRQFVGSEVKQAAMKYGAREDALDHIARLVGGEIDFDENLEPYIKGADGKPAVDAKGQQLTVEGRVRQFLDSNRFYVKGPGGVGGGAPGGASLDNLSDAVAAAQAKVDAAKKTFEADTRNNDALLALHRAEQELAKARNKG
jgi:hypothetical protein